MNKRSCSDQIPAVRCSLGLTSGHDPLKLSRSLWDTRQDDMKIICRADKQQSLSWTAHTVSARRVTACVQRYVCSSGWCGWNEVRTNQIWESRTGNRGSLPRLLRSSEIRPAPNRFSSFSIILLMGYYRSVSTGKLEN